VCVADHLRRVSGNRDTAADMAESGNMPNTLIVFATRHGQTERIALRVAKVLVDGGLAVDIADLRRTPRRPPLERYARIVIAGPVYFGRHPRHLERFIRENRDLLASRDSIFVSVSGAAITDAGKKEAAACVGDLVQRTGWTPKQMLLAGGAVCFTQYNPLLRWMMRRIAAKQGRDTDTSRDYEYTDWTEVEQFARALLPASENVGAL
jgi:menaquinone-dependent protoporphyrinogen oxidase